MNQNRMLKSRINEIISSNLDNPNLNGAFIANELGVNRMYLHRKLKLFYNQNARDYIQSIRIAYAKEQLKTSDESIKIIALQIGYNDFSYFTKTFKKAVGIPPSKFRLHHFQCSDNCV